MPSGAQPAGSGEYKEFTDTAGHKFATEHGKRVPLRGQQAAAGQQQAAQPQPFRVRYKTITDSIAANANLTPGEAAGPLAKVKGMTDEQVGALHAKAEEMKKQKMAVQSVTKPSEQKPAIAPSRPPLDRQGAAKEWLMRAMQTCCRKTLTIIMSNYRRSRRTRLDITLQMATRK